MEKTNFKSIDEYIGSFPQEVQVDLERIRRTVKDAVPEAEEVISYQMPAFKFHGMVVYFAAFKKHYSLFIPSSAEVFEAFEKELAPYKHVKATVQFQKSEAIPFGLIGKMVRFKAQENLRRVLEKK